MWTKGKREKVVGSWGSEGRGLFVSEQALEDESELLGEKQ